MSWQLWVSDPHPLDVFVMVHMSHLAPICKGCGGHDAGSLRSISTEIAKMQMSLLGEEETGCGLSLDRVFSKQEGNVVL